MIKITIEDEVNFVITGLTTKELNVIKKETSIMVKGAFTTAAFKQKIWDGKESLFIVDDETREGMGTIFELPKIVDIIEGVLGYDIDEDVELIDKRDKVVPDDIPEVDENYLIKESGYVLRDYQLDSINAAITLRKGIIDVGTNGGKTWICVGISKAFDPYIKTVVVVPTEKLVRQTYADYEKTDLSVAALTAKVSPSKRGEMIRNHRHIIITTQLFMNIIDYFSDDVWGVIRDEVHGGFGEVFQHVMRFDMSSSPLRIGMSGSLPTTKSDPFKRNMIMSLIGGGVLVKVKQSTLIDRNISSKLSIQMVETSHPEAEDIFDSLGDGFDWSMEEDYNLSNRVRIDAIADYIRKKHAEDPVNTLILCHAGLGRTLSEYLSCGFINESTTPAERDALFDAFSENTDHIFAATFDTSGTGISANRIHRLYLIDVGKNTTHIMQGIGRGLRREAGVKEAISVIDISSNNKYAKRHRQERLKLYRKEKFPFSEKSEKILIIND